MFSWLVDALNWLGEVAASLGRAIGRLIASALSFIDDSGQRTFVALVIVFLLITFRSLLRFFAVLDLVQDVGQLTRDNRGLVSGVFAGIDDHGSALWPILVASAALCLGALFFWEWWLLVLGLVCLLSPLGVLVLLAWLMRRR